MFIKLIHIVVKHALFNRGKVCKIQKEREKGRERKIKCEKIRMHVCIHLFNWYDRKRMREREREQVEIEKHHATLTSDTKFSHFPQNTRTHGRHTQHCANAKIGNQEIRSKKQHKIGKRGFKLLNLRRSRRLKRKEKRKGKKLKKKLLNLNGIQRAD